MNPTRKKLLFALLALLILFLVFAFAYHLPRRIEWSGRTSSVVNGFDVEADVTLELQEWRGFFRDPYYTGSVTVDGERFEDIHSFEPFREDNPFIPVSLKEDFGGRQLEVYRRYVKVTPWAGGVVEVRFHPSDTDPEDPQGTFDRVFCINTKASGRGAANP